MTNLGIKTWQSRLGTDDPNSVTSEMQIEINQLRVALAEAHSNRLDPKWVIGMGGERREEPISQVVQVSLLERCVDLSDKLFELAGDFTDGHASQIISMSSLLKIYSHQLAAGAKIAASKSSGEVYSLEDQYANVIDELPEPVHHIMVDGKCIGYFSVEQMLQLRVKTAEQCAKLMESPNNNYAQVLRKKMGI